MNPKVSIIIPVYNGEKFIKKSIKSALKQNYKNLEVIVVNDGSTDNTDKIVKKFNNKIKYISKENGGVSSALNLGIKNASGEYISWLSHDDLYKTNKIKVQINYLNKCKQSNVILYSNYAFITENGRVWKKSQKMPYEELEKYPELALLKGYINGITLLIPKEAFEKYGYFNEKLKCTQDYDKWLEFYDNYKFVCIPKSLVQTRLHSAQTTNTSPFVKIEGNILWHKIINWLSDDRIIEIFGSKKNYYNEMLNFLRNTPYDDVIEYCEEKVKNEG